MKFILICKSLFTESALESKDSREGKKSKLRDYGRKSSKNGESRRLNREKKDWSYEGKTNYSKVN